MKIFYSLTTSIQSAVVNICNRDLNCYSEVTVSLFYNLKRNLTSQHIYRLRQTNSTTCRIAVKLAGRTFLTEMTDTLSHAPTLSSFYGTWTMRKLATVRQTAITRVVLLSCPAVSQNNRNQAGLTSSGKHSPMGFMTTSRKSQTI